MGGAVTGGNWSAAAEFNIVTDPEAAHIVFGAGWPVTMVGLDLTHQALATPDVVDRIAALGTRPARFVTEVLEFFGTTYRAEQGFPHPPVHDPCAVARVIDPAVLTTRRAPVTVELAGSHTRGMTVADLRAPRRRTAARRWRWTWTTRGSGTSWSTPWSGSASRETLSATWGGPGWCTHARKPSSSAWWSSGGSSWRRPPRRPPPTVERGRAGDHPRPAQPVPGRRGVAPLVWDDQLAADAQVWVDELVARGGTLAHDNPADPNDPATGQAKGEGENLAGGQSAATAPAQWYAEKPQFDAAPNKSGFNDTNPDWVNWGHYTQMMWSATTTIGCGTAPGPRYQITSCRYRPPGNFDGQLPYPDADTLRSARSPHRDGRSRKRGRPTSRPSSRRRSPPPPTTERPQTAHRPRPARDVNGG